MDLELISFKSADQKCMLVNKLGIDVSNETIGLANYESWSWIPITYIDTKGNHTVSKNEDDELIII